MEIRTGGTVSSYFAAWYAYIYSYLARIWRRGTLALVQRKRCDDDLRRLPNSTFDLTWIVRVDLKFLTQQCGLTYILKLDQQQTEQTRYKLKIEDVKQPARRARKKLYSGIHDYHEFTIISKEEIESKCVVCHETTTCPTKTSCCKRLICYTCVTKLHYHDHFICPMCRCSEYEVSEHESVLGLKVRCKNAMLGCSWVGTLREGTSHIENDCQLDKPSAVSVAKQADDSMTEDSVVEQADDITTEEPADQQPYDTTTIEPVDEVTDDTTTEEPADEGADDTTTEEPVDKPADDTTTQTPVDKPADDTTTQTPVDKLADDITTDKPADGIMCEDEESNDYYDMRRVKTEEVNNVEAVCDEDDDEDSIYECGMYKMFRGNVCINEQEDESDDKTVENSQCGRVLSKYNNMVASVNIMNRKNQAKLHEIAAKGSSLSSLLVKRAVKLPPTHLTTPVTKKPIAASMTPTTPAPPPAAFYAIMTRKLTKGKPSLTPLRKQMTVVPRKTTTTTQKPPSTPLDKRAKVVTKCPFASYADSNNHCDGDHHDNGTDGGKKGNRAGNSSADSDGGHGNGSDCRDSRGGGGDKGAAEGYDSRPDRDHGDNETRGKDDHGDNGTNSDGHKDIHRERGTSSDGHEDGHGGREADGVCKVGHGEYGTGGGCGDGHGDGTSGGCKDAHGACGTYDGYKDSHRDRDDSGSSQLPKDIKPFSNTFPDNPKHSTVSRTAMRRKARLTHVARPSAGSDSDQSSGFDQRHLLRCKQKHRRRWRKVSRSHRRRKYRDRRTVSRAYQGWSFSTPPVRRRYTSVPELVETTDQLLVNLAAPHTPPTEASVQPTTDASELVVSRPDLNLPRQNERQVVGMRPTRMDTGGRASVNMRAPDFPVQATQSGSSSQSVQMSQLTVRRVHCLPVSSDSTSLRRPQREVHCGILHASSSQQAQSEAAEPVASGYSTPQQETAEQQGNHSAFVFYTPSPGGLCPAFENSGRGSSRVHFCLQTPAAFIPNALREELSRAVVPVFFRSTRGVRGCDLYDYSVECGKRGNFSGFLLVLLSLINCQLKFLKEGVPTIIGHGMVRICGGGSSILLSTYNSQEPQFYQMLSDTLAIFRSQLNRPVKEMYNKVLDSLGEALMRRCSLDRVRTELMQLFVHLHVDRE